MKKRRHKNRSALLRAQSMVSSGNVIPQNIVNATVASMKAKNDTSILFTPGQPMYPQPGVTPFGVPRQWSFPFAYNTGGVDRTLSNPDIPSFLQLRTLARMYSGIALCERVWFDMVPKLSPRIKLRPELVAAGEDEGKYQKQIANLMRFFEKPDGQRDIHSWLRMALKEQTVIDELYIFKRRTRGGQLYALEIVAGDTMKPLLDDWGRIPPAPDPAYQQFPWGVPGDQFSVDELIHYSESPQADTPYGFSRIERIIMEVNQALRKKKQDLSRYTEGNIPAGIMEVPEASNWTPDQIDAYEQMWNALIAGNAQQQVRVKFTQPGMKYTAFNQDGIATEFDQFLLNLTAAAYGVSMADLAITGDIHKSSDDGQQNMLYRRTLYPIVSMYAQILTNVIRDDFGFDDLIFEFSGFEEAEDMGTQAAAYATLIQNAMISPADAARALKLPDIPQTGPMFITQSGPIMLANFAEDAPMRKAQEDAQMAGLQLAIQNPGAKPNDPTDPTQESEEEDTDDSDMEEKPGTKAQGKPPAKGTGAKPGDSQSQGKDSAPGKGSGGAQHADRAAGVELRRWRTCALHDFRGGKRLRAFESDTLPVGVRTGIARQLEGAQSEEEIRAIFAGIRLDDDRFLAGATQGRGANLATSRLLWKSASLQ